MQAVDVAHPNHLNSNLIDHLLALQHLAGRFDKLTENVANPKYLFVHKELSAPTTAAQTHISELAWDLPLALLQLKYMLAVYFEEIDGGCNVIRWINVIVHTIVGNK